MPGAIQAGYIQAWGVSRKTGGNKLSVPSLVSNGATGEIGTGCGWGAQHALSLHHYVIFGKGQHLWATRSVADLCQMVLCGTWSRLGGLREREDWIFPGTISHLISHLCFQSSFLLHSHFPLRERAWATEERAQCGSTVIALVLEREPMAISRRSESPVLTLPGTSFKAPSGRVFLGNTETFLTALAVHMRVVGRVSLLQDGHIWNLTSCGNANDKGEKKRRENKDKGQSYSAAQKTLLGVKEKDWRKSNSVRQNHPMPAWEAQKV